jgi:hypothetical protein
VPAPAQHDQNIRRGCTCAGNSGDHHCLLCQCEYVFTGTITIRLGCSADTFFALFCSFFRDFYQNQAHWPAVVLPKNDSSFADRSNLFRKKACEINAASTASR